MRFIFVKDVFNRKMKAGKLELTFLIILLFNSLCWHPPAGAEEQEISFPSADKIEEQKIVVKHFEILGNTIFSDRELEELLAGFKGRSLTFSELSEVPRAITEYYKQKGFLASFARLVPQNLGDEVVRIQVVEGYIESINVVIKGKTLTSEYVLVRLNKIIRKPITLKELNEALLILKSQELVKNLTFSGFEEGERRGLIVLKIEVETENRLAILLIANNQGSPLLGTFNRGISTRLASLLTTGDQFLINYINNDGSNLIAGSYTFPVTVNSELSFSAGNNDARVLASPFVQLNPRTDLFFAKVEFNRTIFETPNQKFKLGAAFFVGKKSRFFDRSKISF